MTQRNRKQNKERNKSKPRNVQEKRPAADKVVVVGWLLNVPATGQCISGTDLLRQPNVLPH